MTSASEVVAAPSHQHRISNWHLFAYASPAIPMAAVTLPIFAYLPQWYAEHTALSLAVIGAIFGASKIWDVVTDPVVGLLSDRFSSRFGRRRPWMVMGTPVMLLATFALFLRPLDPDVSEQLDGVYLAIWLIVLYTGWTLLSVSHMSWGAELSTDYDQRSRILGTRELFYFMGTIVILILPALIERSGGSSTQQIASMGYGILLLLPLAVLLAVTVVGEKPVVPRPSIEWRAAVSALVGNRPLRMLIVVDFALTLSYSLQGSMFLWMAREVLQLGAWSSGLLFVFLVSGCLCIPLIVRVSSSLGKHRTLALTNMMSVLLCPLLLILPAGNVALAAIVFAFLSINIAAGPVLSRAIAADVVDYDELRSGQARTGLIFSLATMTNKIGAAAGVSIAFTLLGIIGFVPNEAHNPETLANFRLLYVAAPVIVNILVIAVMLRFPIDRARQLELRRQIEARSL